MALGRPTDTSGATTRANTVAKPEWGDKHLCASCGAKFYDMERRPMTCPRCSTVHEPPPIARGRRSAASAPKVVKPVVAPVVAKVEVVAEVAVAADAAGDKVADAADAALVKIDDDDENGNTLIEDPSELGEDEDDVAEVLEGQIKDDKEDR